MNFLSHYYHELPVNDAYYTVGLVLPDILSNYSKRTGRKVRLNPAKLNVRSLDNSEQLAAGVRQHYFVDGFFHDSVFFETFTDLIEQGIRQKEYHCFQKRLFAFSHIFLELMLDRTLILKEPQTCEELYTRLEQVDSQMLHEFLTDQDLGSDAAGVAGHVETFIQRRFLFHYTDNERFITILSHLNAGFGNPAFTETDKNIFMHTIEEVEAALMLEKFPKFPSDF